MGFDRSLSARSTGNPVIASETCAFDMIGARFERDVEPGENSHISKKTLSAPCRQMIVRRQVLRVRKKKIYLPGPTAIWEVKAIYEPPLSNGKKRLASNTLSKQMPSCRFSMAGYHAAHGYAQARGIELVEAFVRNHYALRKFIKPTQAGRDPYGQLQAKPQYQSLVKGGQGRVKFSICFKGDPIFSIGFPRFFFLRGGDHWSRFLAQEV